MASKLTKAAPLYLQAYEQLKIDIIEGKLRPNERLTDKQLADWLGISRTPVREAVRILCAEKLFVNENGNISVYKPTIRDVCQIYLLRASIESLATSIIAIKNNKEEILNKLSPAVNRSIQAAKEGDLKTVQKLNTHFHHSLVHYSDLEALIEAYSPLETRMKIIRSMSLSKDLHRKISVEEHLELINAIAQGNVTACKILAEKHILNAAKRAIKHFVEMEGTKNESIVEETYKYIDQYLSDDH
ncbi:MAG: GntR family transcriptional regulator [Bacillota bacterium]